MGITADEVVCDVQLPLGVEPADDAVLQQAVQAVGLQIVAIEHGEVQGFNAVAELLPLLLDEGGISNHHASLK